MPQIGFSYRGRHFSFKYTDMKNGKNTNICHGQRDKLAKVCVRQKTKPEWWCKELVRCKIFMLWVERLQIQLKYLVRTQGAYSIQIYDTTDRFSRPRVCCTSRLIDPNVLCMDMTTQD